MPLDTMPQAMANGDSAEAGSTEQMIADESSISGVGRRGFFRVVGGGLAAVAGVPGFAGLAAAAPVVNGGTTIHDGLTVERSGYDYAPSVMYGDGDNLQIWWCGPGSKPNSGDSAYYSERTNTGWSNPAEVLTTGNGNAWDSEHVCDPSVIKGNFIVDGSTWAYALYYSATDDKFGSNTRIGAAFSNDGTNWQKYSNNPVVVPSVEPTDGYGAGMQTAYREPGTNANVVLAFFDSTSDPKNHYVESTDGVSFGSRTDLTANPSPHHAIGDIAYFPDEGVWYVCTKHNNDEECYLYKTSTSDLNSSWTEAGRINNVTTGNTHNHNPCWKRHPNGDLREEPTTRYKHVYFGTGTDDPNSWDIGNVRYLDGWEFDDDGNKEGWTSGNVSGDSNEPTNGTWEVTADQDDPHFDSPDQNFTINVDVASRVKIRMANQNDDTNGRLFFRTDWEDVLTLDKSVTFDVDTTGEWVLYDLDMSQNSNWTGMVTSLRLDPVQSGTGDPLAIDYLRVDS